MPLININKGKGKGKQMVHCGLFIIFKMLSLWYNVSASKEKVQIVIVFPQTG